MCNQQVSLSMNQAVQALRGVADELCCGSTYALVISGKVDGKQVTSLSSK